RGLTGGLSGGINSDLGNMFNYNGPMLWTAYLFHDNNVTTDQVMAAVDQVITKVQTEPVDRQTLDRALVKLRSNLYDTTTGLFGFGRADLLASFALFDDDPKRINSLEAEFRKVTPELIQRTAREHLRTANRTILAIEPAAAQPSSTGR
ncbi:MAG: M16 family metallopeptidase, partial [Pyrinomonadaceae bacterium]